MVTWDYVHHIEYWHELSPSQRVHKYTEVVEDHGWCFIHKKEKRQEWLAFYTKSYAVDYFERFNVAAGTWVVSVYRLIRGERLHICSIRTQWTDSSTTYRTPQQIGEPDSTVDAKVQVGQPAAFAGGQYDQLRNELGDAPG